MQRKPESTIFKFILSHQQLFSNLDHLKLNNYERFLKIGETGKQIQLLSKQNNQKQLAELCDNNFFEIQFMQLEILDAFSTALHLRNQQIVAYYLNNGIDLDKVQPGCIVQLCYSLEYLRHDPPIQLFRLLLEFGGNPRYADNSSDTGMHIAAKIGSVQFMKLLVEYGGDINAVNDEKMTPLGCAIKNKQHAAIAYLKSQNANQKWNS